MCDRWKKLAAPVLGIAVLLVLWYGVCRAGIFSAYVLPPPAKVLNSFFKMLQTGELWRDVWISFLRVMKGFSIAFVLAFIIIYLALKLILFSLDLIARLPVLHGINKTAGLLLGLAESLVFIWVFFLAITIFFTGKTGENLMGMVNDSLFLRFLYSNNYLLKIISAIVLGV